MMKFRAHEYGRQIAVGNPFARSLVTAFIHSNPSYTIELLLVLDEDAPNAQKSSSGAAMGKRV